MDAAVGGAETGRTIVYWRVVVLTSCQCARTIDGKNLVFNQGPSLGAVQKGILVKTRHSQRVLGEIELRTGLVLEERTQVVADA